MIYPHYYQRLRSLHQDKSPVRLNVIQTESLWVKQLAYPISSGKYPDGYDWRSNNVKNSCLACTACSTRNSDAQLTSPLSEFKIHRCQSRNNCKQREGSYWLQLILAATFIKKVRTSFEVFSQLGQMIGKSLSGVYGWLPSKNQINKQSSPKPNQFYLLLPNHRHHIHLSLTKKRTVWSIWSHNEAWSLSPQSWNWTYLNIIPWAADFPNLRERTEASRKAHTGFSDLDQDDKGHSFNGGS